MKAIILAAGYATRLYPITKDKPKPLIKVANKAICEHITDKLNQIEEIDEIFVVTNDKFYNHFLEWSKKYDSAKKIHVLNDQTLSNEDRLGSIGDFNYTLDLHNVDDDVILLAGDNLFEYSIRAFIDFFYEKDSSVIALCDLKEPAKLAKKFGEVHIDENLRVNGFTEKPEFPKTSICGTCCYIYKKEDCKKLKEYLRVQQNHDQPGEFARWISENSRLHGFLFQESWFDIGSFESLEEARLVYEKKLEQEIKVKI